MDLEKFLEEFRTSQINEELTEYCKTHWDEALEYFPNGFHDMDSLLEATNKSLVSRSVDSLSEYQDVVENIKKGGSDEWNG